ncbi:hypothetical protein QA640_08500 [Bradyrhizobium sp. CB82]|uniref:hypothetical protein n=1 Tax=Bradyrhizobium sp. CB82 TaxID=3039159 RepID=UPI0024B25877|nr:hypothetical protein [Bradyrhizobium sp. CB82]WFU44977.1 hypothetical protein QA640_08500 [Bradyrhizobium sp. CB82]
MIRRLMVPITAAMVTMGAASVQAQSAFPAPLPGQAAAPANDPAFPPVNGSAPVARIGAPPPQASFPTNGAPPVGAGVGAAPPSAPSAGAEQCMKNFMALRDEAEKRGKMIKAASDRKAPPDEACKLIGNFAQAEVKMVKYVEANAAKCGIPPQIGEQLKAGHKNTEAMQGRVCQVAQQMKQRGPAGPSLSEVLGSASAPEANVAKKGGNTFDTLNGNVLTR